MINVNKPYSLKQFILTVAIPIVTLWTILFLHGYPLAGIDDVFFTGAPINLAKGGEFTNPYIESWNSVISSGKFYFQPPFYSFVLAGWLKVTGISTISLLLFQYLCNIVFSLCTALILRFYGFPKITAICTTIFFATWFCNPNPQHSLGFRHDTLGMAFLTLGLYLLTQDKLWRYFWGFTFIESAVFTSPIAISYSFSLGVAILAINFIDQWKRKKIDRYYLLKRIIIVLLATVVVFTFFLLCINFDLKTFWTDFSFHTAMRRSPINEALNVFLLLSTQGYGMILIFPTYILFVLLMGVCFAKRHTINIRLKILLFGLTLGIILCIFLYSATIWYTFYFAWIGIVCILSQIDWQQKMKTAVTILAVFIFLVSQSLNILSLVGREYVPESKYQEIRNFVLANPHRKYAIDEVAARFVFDYKFPKNSTSWTFMQVPGTPQLTAKDKLPDVTWIVSIPNLGKGFPEMLKEDYPRVEFFGLRFKSLPKKPFDLIVVP